MSYFANSSLFKLQTLQRLLLLCGLGLLLNSTACKDENCNFPTQPLAPSGYSIQELTQTPAQAQDTRRWQMLSPDLGYFLDDEDLYKITDGGATWTALTLPTDGVITDFVFVDEQLGYLTYAIENDRADLLKTVDGGQTFEQLSYPEFESSLRYIAAGDDGALYVQIGAFDDSVGILRSDDGGQTFRYIFLSGQPFINNLSVVGNKLYFLEGSENLLITNLEGISINAYQVPVVNNDPQLIVLSKDELMFNGRRGVFRSINSGADWSVVDSGFDSDLLGGSLESGTFMMLTRPFCGDNLDEPSALAIFDQNLSIGETTQNVEPSSITGVLKDGGKWLLLHEGRVWEVVKE